jgi:hypothetical protein
MNSVLKVHPWFFKEFASKTWTSPYSIITELVENSFDEDATKVLITLIKDGSIFIEDDVGMDESGFGTFLLVGSPHKLQENLSPYFKRPRSGRYGTGRLGFLTSFKKMIIKTRRGDHSRSILIDENVLEKLVGGEAELEEYTNQRLNRNGTEVCLTEPKLKIDISRLRKELRRLAILTYPYFGVYLKESTNYQPWNFDGAERLIAPQVEGIKITVKLPDIIGEIVVTRRPLSEEERGLAIIVGSHLVERKTFDLNIDRITGWLRCDSLNARFADKASLIEDETFQIFYRRMKTFISDEIIPQVKGLIEATITREEVRVYKQVDSLLADAVHNILEPSEQEEEIWVNKGGPDDKQQSNHSLKKPEVPQHIDWSSGGVRNHVEAKTENNEFNRTDDLNKDANLGIFSSPYIYEKSADLQSPTSNISLTQANKAASQPQNDISHKMVQKTKIRRTFTLKKVGFRVVPYEDIEDEKEAFAEHAVIYINKAHSTYRTEAQRGASLLLRHVVRLVSKVIALERYPEGRDALELQNRLIAETIRLTRSQYNEHKM